MSSIPNSLDQVVAPQVVQNIIGLFFDYVYPLTPCLHRPTFIADLAARKDTTDPVFFALTLLVLASTLVQVPRVLVSLDKDEVEALARRCVRVARAKMAYIWDDAVPMRAEYGECPKELQPKFAPKKLAANALTNSPQWSSSTWRVSCTCFWATTRRM